MTTTDELDAIARAAASAAPRLAGAAPAERIRWLDALADALDADATALIEIAHRETHLDHGRLRGEVARTSGQLRLFSRMIDDGGYLEVIIDSADPVATPPRPELRRLLVPIGPVAVFAASNFPFAFSVLGGDTASALSVGCPVVVKAHEGHPETSRRTARIAERALAEAGAPAGSFALVEGFEAGVALVQHPLITAAAFTGSLRGGRALFDLAARRPAPIPFYGELGSINPVIVTREALREQQDELARGLAQSFTLGAGQYCTKPGVVFVPAGADFASRVADHLPPTPPAQLLTPRIAEAFARDIAEIGGEPRADVVSGDVPQDPGAATPVILHTRAQDLEGENDEILAERFGPTTLIAEYDDDRDLRAALEKIPGSLTATLHAGTHEDVTDLVPVLAARAGRVLFGGWPTGVAVTWSQHHGGPWPATTSVHTSVGVSAARRFQRPLVYQDAPARALPEALRDGNPLRVPRRVDGVLELPNRDHPT